MSKDAVSIVRGGLADQHQVPAMGSLNASDRTLNFRVLAEVWPWVGALLLDRVRGAFDRMASGQVNCRMVLTMRARCQL